MGMGLGFAADLEAGSPSGFAFETITLTNGGATTLTAGTYKSAGGNAVRAVLTFETASARYRYDGTAPTTAVGHLVQIVASNTVTVILDGPQNIANWKGIATTATNCTVSVTYER